MELVLEVVRESSGLLCANLSLLFFITLTLIFPVSSITLSQVFTNGLLSGKLSSHFQGVAEAGGLLESPFNRALYLHLSQALLCQALCFPVIITLWLLAKTAILYIIGCSHHGKEASIVGFLNEGPWLWSRLAVTYLWICLMVLGFASCVILSPLLVAGLVESLALSGSFLGLLETPLVVVYSVAFAHMLIVFNLATVVSVVEKRWGGGALLKALFLLRARMQPALLLFLLSTVATFMVECVFQQRVLGGIAAAASALWEAPLLIFLYSFLYLFDTIMTFVLYHACQQQDASDRENAPPHETHCTLEHFSIAVEMMEQCRKMYSV